MSTSYRSHIGDAAFDIEIDGDVATLDGLEARLHPLGGPRYLLEAGARHVEVVIQRQPDGTLGVTLDGQYRAVRVQDEAALLKERFGIREDDAAGSGAVHAPMPGLVLRILVEPGQVVAAGDGLVVLEAMKMENELKAPSAGTVATVHATEGDAVNKGALLVSVETD
ncbi:MAG: acetyl-CoA carboxylase biotin carboxyl carrier protein subunit [Rhodothermales bacterium]